MKEKKKERKKKKKKKKKEEEEEEEEDTHTPHKKGLLPHGDDRLKRPHLLLQALSGQPDRSTRSHKCVLGSPAAEPPLSDLSFDAIWNFLQWVWSSLRL